MRKSIIFRIDCDPIVRIGSFVNPRWLPADTVEPEPVLYDGGGALVNVPDIDQVINGTAARFDIIVSGVTATTVGLAREEAASVKGADCYIGNAYFDDAWQLTEVEWLAVLRADTVTTAHQGSTRSITLSISSGDTERSKAPIAFFTDADQRRRSPTDRIFDHVSSISAGTSRRFGPNDA